MKVEIEVRGTRTFSAKLAGSKARILVTMNEMLREIGRLFAPVLKSGTPRRTGKLANSTRFQVLGIGDDMRLEVRQGARSPEGAFYGAFVRGGTAPHVIRPRKAHALHFQVGGQDVFAMKVNHPGTQPNPYHVRALNQVRGGIAAILERTGGKITAYLADVRGQP